MVTTHRTRLSRAGARQRRCFSLRPRARRLIALQAAVKPEACLLRAVQVCAGTPGAAMLSLASAHPIAAHSGATNCGFQVQPHEAKDGTERRPQEPCFPCCGDLNSRGFTAYRPNNDMRTNDMKSWSAGVALPRRSRRSSAPTAPTGAPADGETHGRKGVQKVRPFGACCTRGRHHGLCRRRRPGSRARKHRCAARAEWCSHLT